MSMSMTVLMTNQKTTVTVVVEWLLQAAVGLVVLVAAAYSN